MDTSKISDVAKQVLVDWMELGFALAKLSDFELVELAEDFTSELSIDSPVYALVTELCERIGGGNDNGK